ncbi:MAG: PAS domain S-box protein [Thermodesulfobacteriota bacterium]
MDGFSVCAELYRQPEYQKIPIIFISGLDDPDSKLRAFEIGGVDYITKPFQKTEVLARVQNHLTLVHHRRTLESARDLLEEKVKERTAELANSEERFRSLVEQSSDLIWAVDSDCTYIYASPQVETILGYKPEKVIGKTLFDLMPPEEADRLAVIFSDLMKSHKPIVQLEKVNLHRDGSRITLETSGVPYFDGSGKIVGYRGVDRDVSERKKAEEQLHVYENIIAATQELMSFVDENYVYRAVNDAYCSYHDLKREDIVGKTAADILGQDVFERTVKQHLDHALAGHTVQYESWFDYAGQGMRYMVVTYNPFHNTEQIITGVGVMVRDHTERKQAEELLSKSEEQFRRLVEKAPDIIYRYSDQHGGSYYSPRVEALLGYTPEYLLEHPQLWHDSIHPDDLVMVDAAIADLFYGKDFDIEYRIRDAQGTYHWFHDRNTNIQVSGQGAVVEGLASDITERKQTEELLLKQHHRLKQISEIQRIFLTSTEDTLYNDILDYILKYVDCEYGYFGFIDEAGDLVCPSMVFGVWDQCQIPGKQVVFPKKEWSGIWGESLIQKKSLFKNRDLTLPKGHLQLANAIALPVLYRDKLIGQMALANRSEDFTDDDIEKLEEILVQIAPALQAYLSEGRRRKKELQAQKLIRRAKEEWEKTFDAIDDIVTIQDKDMHIIRANRAAHVYLGKDDDELIGNHCYTVFSGTTEPCPGCPLPISVETLKPHSQIVEHKGRGTTFHISSSPMLDQNSEIEFLVHIARDITEQKCLEEQVFQSHKMEAIGTMAGGIAHDFNNILSAIISFANLARQDVPANSSAEKKLAAVIQAGRRGAELVQQILTFSRKSEHQLQQLSPHLIVREVLNMLHSSLPSTVVIVEDIDRRCGKILADPTNIHQILINLCTNALHAMENEKGILTIKLSQKAIAADEIRHEAEVTAGPFIVLSISDTGCGMDEEVKERIFEPFFTTKEAGKGTGMGLSVVHGIVHDYKGFLTVESFPGKGSTFSVYLPLVKEESSDDIAPATTEEIYDETSLRGTERILVVDDEPLLVKVNELQLRQLGYRVTGTTDSRDALHTIQTDPEQFDLIITDQTMPGLSGIELAKEVQKINPMLPIILCTGHSDIVTKEKALTLGIKRYVSKPILKDELLQAIRDVLD